MYGCTVRINEPVGVVGIACPDDYPLLAFVSLFSPAVVRGNTVIIIPSEKYPLSATDLYQVRHIFLHDCVYMHRQSVHINVTTVWLANNILHNDADGLFINFGGCINLC